MTPLWIAAAFRAPAAADANALRLRPRLDKARSTYPSERSMFGPATFAIVAFVLVIAVLNRIEFGRFD